ncbi:DUF3618 domain-containing protein [Microbacterium sp. JZ101]
MTDSPDAIRADIERTRRELGRDADALVDKVTPSKIMDRQTSRLKGAFGSLRERVMGAADDAGSSVHDAGETVADATHRAAAKAEGNPMAVGLIAFGVGLLASSLIPASGREKRIAQDVREQAQPLVDEVKDVAQEVGAHLREPAQQAAESIRDTATEAAEHVKSEAQGSADAVAGRAQEARDNVQGS